MGTGCSGLSPSQQTKQKEQSLAGKSSGHGFTAQKNISNASLENNKQSTPRPLSRVVGFVTARSVTSGIDVGSKCSSASLGSSSFWTHDDDDRIDELINRWKAAEVLYLKVSINQDVSVNSAHMREIC